MKYRRSRLAAILLTLTAVSWGALKQIVNAPVPPPDPPAEEAEE